MQTLGSVTIQGITYTEKTLSSGVTVTYQGASALSVSVTGQAITVFIIDGTSTNTLIAAAIRANSDANALVTLSSITGATTPHTCVNVPLAGGVTTSVNASGDFGPLHLQAVTAGTGGNAITFAYTSGGSLVVTTVGSAISVQLVAGTLVARDPDNPSSSLFLSGASTAADVVAAINADVSASALVLASSKLPEATPTVANAPSPTNLTGGLDAAPATLTNQGVTVTSNTNDATQNGKTLTYTSGGTAGAEVVTVTGGNVSVQIQVGTSTVTQIRTALNADTAFNILYTATGTASTTPLTVNQVVTTGQADTAPVRIPLPTIASSNPTTN